MPPPDRRLSRLQVLARDEALTLRLGDGFLEPCHLVGAAVLADLHRDRLTVVAPLDANVARYASRMHLPRVFDDLEVRHDLGRVREKDLRTNLQEVVRLESGDDVRALAELVFRRVEAYDLEAARRLWESITEAGLNVGEHAGAVGYGAAQVIPASGEVLFAVADAGFGLLGTLRGKGATNDRQALDLALDGTSRLDDPCRGWGIRTTVDAVGGVGGSLYVASGSASTTAAGGRRQQPRSLDDPWVGTMLQGRVPTVRTR